MFGLLPVLNGCVPSKTSLSATPGEVPGLPPVASFAGDIRDINVPAEMEIDRSQTNGIETESFRGGVYVYKGNVSMLSLKDYMVQSMQGNKWKKVGETSTKDIMLAFVKPSKTCMMIISDGGRLGKTTLAFYVTIDQTAATALNPFGEAVGE